jgi:two-component system sensor histidine kinase RegB
MAFREATTATVAPHDGAARARASTQASWLLGVRLAELAAVGALVLAPGAAVPEALRTLFVGALALNAGYTLLHRRRSLAARPFATAALLALDAVVVTLALASRGGPTNPASVLFLVISSLGALLLPLHEAALVLGATVGGYALLLFGPAPFGSASCHVDASAYAEHLRGMFVVNAFASAFLVAVVHRLRSALARVEASLAEAERRKRRHEKLASLSSLAATAAHELGTPLGTIRVVAKELERAAERLGDEGLRDDARLVRAEVERCRALLGELGQRAGSAQGEAPVSLEATAFVAEIHALLAERGLGARIDLEPALARFRAPRVALLRCIANLVKNACDASAPTSAPPRVRFALEDGSVCIHVDDDGAGMSDEVLAQVGEPFFTTKAEGRGLGLGVFLARELAEGLDGELVYARRTPRGMRATLRWPHHEPAPESP